ncbi:MAG TPA: hypothetical protein VEY10_12545 [Flavisolibacter sp.]|nr:hypothetical protein [Flavisolibacter sp.]
MPNRKEAKGRTPLILVAYRYDTWHTEAAAKGGCNSSAGTNCKISLHPWWCTR